MSVVRDISIKIDPVQLLRNEGNSDNELIVKTAAWAAETAARLASPAFVYHYFPVAFAAKQLKVAATFLQIGPMIRLLKKAQEVAVAVVTVGAAIEEKVNQLQSNNELLEGYLLNCAAFMALDAVALNLKTRIENTAEQRNWGVGPALSPGALPGWPTSDQNNLCALVDLNQIGVTIKESALLVPRYSLSLLVGMGPGYDSRKVEATCGYCSLKNTCQYRNRDEIQSEK